MRRPPNIATFVLAAGLVLGGAACGDDDRRDAEDAVEDAREEGRDAASSASDALDEGTDAAAEAAVRNLAATHGADEFEANDHPIDGDLRCEATVADGEDAVDVRCTGTTTDGEDAELSGTTSEIPGASATELEGDFTGTVAGEEVFSVDALGADG